MTVSVDECTLGHEHDGNAKGGQGEDGALYWMVMGNGLYMESAQTEVVICKV